MATLIAFLALALAAYAIADRKLERRAQMRRILRVVSHSPSPSYIEGLVERLQRIK
jgi:hypothetical protein